MTGCGFDSLSEMKYLLYSLLRSGVKVKRGDEFRLVTRNTLGSPAYPAVCGIQREAGLIFLKVPILYIGGQLVSTFFILVCIFCIHYKGITVCG